MYGKGLANKRGLSEDDCRGTESVKKLTAINHYSGNPRTGIENWNDRNDKLLEPRKQQEQWRGATPA